MNGGASSRKRKRRRQPRPWLGSYPGALGEKNRRRREEGRGRGGKTETGVFEKALDLALEKKDPKKKLERRRKREAARSKTRLDEVSPQKTRLDEVVSPRKTRQFRGKRANTSLVQTEQTESSHRSPWWPDSKRDALSGTPANWRVGRSLRRVSIDRCQRRCLPASRSRFPVRVRRHRRTGNPDWRQDRRCCGHRHRSSRGPRDRPLSR